MSTGTSLQERSVPNLTHLQGSLLVLLSGVLFSFGGLFFRSTSTATAWEYLIFRGLGMLSITTVIFFVQNRHRLRVVRSRFQPVHVFIGILLAGMNILFIVALEFASVAFVLFLQPAAPIAAAYFSWVLAREPMSRAAMVAAAIAIVGVTVMVSGSLLDDFSLAGLIALGIPLMLGYYTTVVRSSTHIDPSVPLITAGATLLVVCSSVALLAGGIDISSRDAAVSFVAGSLLLGAPLAVFNTAQRVVPPTETTLLLLIEVILAPVWVWVFVAEEPEALTLVGGSIILAAVIWLTSQRSPRMGRSFSSRG
jgi:drug/metabolite transporter (DMT)-like permease